MSRISQRVIREQTANPHTHHYGRCSIFIHTNGSSASSTSTRRPLEKSDDHDSAEYPKVLVVSQSETTTGPENIALPSLNTNEEAKYIRTSFRSHADVLETEAATVEAVLEGMRTYHWVHFACHGIQDDKDRSNSRFCLHGGSLTLSKLMSESLPSAQLAVLSACQTAVGDKELPEEAVHLAAGMLNAGYKSVVGTMWSIEDDTAPTP